MVVRLLDEFTYDFQLVNLCIILDSRLLSEQLINDFIDSLQRHLYFVNASYLFTHISYEGKTYTITAQEPSIYIYKVILKNVHSLKQPKLNNDSLFDNYFSVKLFHLHLLCLKTQMQVLLNLTILNANLRNILMALLQYLR